MIYLFKPYDDTLINILENGTWRTNKRTNLKTKVLFGVTTRYNLQSGHLPIITRRKSWPKSIIAELLWFISGSTNNKDLQALGSEIWTPWVDKEFEKKHDYIEGAFGPVYGFQLRHFGGYYGSGAPTTTEEFHTKWETVKGDPIKYGDGGFDQLAYMMERIKSDHSDRRILFSLWNPKDLNKMRLPPCHYTYQVLIDDNGLLTGCLTQRSCDFPIGIPANILFYSLLTMMIAQQTGYHANELVVNSVDAHIYEDQIDAIKQYLDTPIIESPTIEINKAADIYSYKLDDFVLKNYNPGPHIKIPVAV